MIAYWVFAGLASTLFFAYLVIFARRAVANMRADGERFRAEHRAWVEAERRKNDDFLRSLREREGVFDRQAQEDDRRHRERLDSHNRRIEEYERERRASLEAQRKRLADLDARLIAAGIDPQTIDESLDDEEAPAPPARWTAPDGMWTEPDLHLFPQDGHRYEIVDGSLHVAPPAPRWHDVLVSAVVTTLRAAAPPGWWVCDRTGIEIDGSNLVPDVTVLRPRSSGATWNDPADVALVVEIETPATRRYDRILKPSLYAEAGISDYWRVEPGPVTPVLHVHELGPTGYRLRTRVGGAEPVKLSTPYPVQVATAAWA